VSEKSRTDSASSGDLFGSQQSSFSLTYLRELIEGVGHQDQQVSPLEKLGFSIRIINEISTCHKIVQVTFLKKEKKSSKSKFVQEDKKEIPTKRIKSFLMSYTKQGSKQFISLFSLDENLMLLNSDVYLILAQNDDQAR
jgi:hypothetical protein